MRLPRRPRARSHTIHILGQLVPVSFQIHRLPVYPVHTDRIHKKAAPCRPDVRIPPRVPDQVRDSDRGVLILAPCLRLYESSELR